MDRLQKKILGKSFYGDWHSIIASKTEKVFEERFTTFQLKYI